MDPAQWLAFEQQKHTQLLAAATASRAKEPAATAADKNKVPAVATAG
jgi:hypothetical protein